MSKSYKTVTKTQKETIFINRFVTKLAAVMLALVISLSGGISAYALDIGSIFDGLIPTSRASRRLKQESRRGALLKRRRAFPLRLRT